MSSPAGREALGHLGKDSESGATVAAMHSAVARENSPLQSLLAVLSEAVLVLDPDSKAIDQCNAAVQNVLGYLPDELIGRSASVLFLNPEQFAAFEKRAQEALERGETLQTELLMRRKDERIIRIASSTLELRNEAGVRVAVIIVLQDVSGRKRPTVEQEETQDLYQRIAEMANEGIWLVDRQGRTTYVNRRMAQLLGLPAAEMEGRYVSEFVFEEDRALAKGRIGANLEGRTEQFDFRFRRADGGEVLVLASTSPLVNANGAIVGALGMFSDVTGQRRTVEAVARLAAIVNSSEDAIVSKTIDGIIVSWNPAAERMFGYSAAEAIGKPISIIYPPDHIDEFPAILARLRRGEHIDHYETERIRKDGRRLFVSVSISPLRDETGKIVGASKIARDITERKRAEKAQEFLAQATTLLSATLDYETTLKSLAQLTVPFLADWAVVYVKKEDGAIQRVALKHSDSRQLDLALEIEGRFSLNPKAETGVPLVLRTGAPLFLQRATARQLAADADDPARLAELTESLGVNSWICVPLSSRGRTFGAISFIRTTPGHEYSIEEFDLAQELARRAALAVENAQLYSEARQAIQMRDQFLSIASHELKTPLTVLTGYTELLQRNTGPNGVDGDRAAARRNRAVAVIHEQAARLNRLVGSLLDVSRIQDGRFNIEHEPFDLHSLVAELIKEVESGLDKHRVAYEGTESPVMILGDALRMEQVVQNLLQNAIKYSLKGGVIRVRLERDLDRASLSISDPGIGIPPDALSQLFTRFYRADNAEKLHISGMGIGLFVVKEIVTLHGGAVRVESEEGKGSTFTVELPIMQAQA